MSPGTAGLSRISIFWYPSAGVPQAYLNTLGTPPRNSFTAGVPQHWPGGLVHQPQQRCGAPQKGRDHEAASGLHPRAHSKGRGAGGGTRRRCCGDRRSARGIRGRLPVGRACVGRRSPAAAAHAGA
eukprot:224177-Chlamydomonas_euryale.AAC.1